MTKYPGNKFIPHDSSSYFGAREYLLAEFTFVDQYALERGKDL